VDRRIGDQPEGKTVNPGETWQNVEARRRADKSWWLHIAVAAAVIADPDAAMNHAARTLDRFGDLHSDCHLCLQWREILDNGVDAAVSVLVGRSYDDHELSRHSPFVGLINQTMRLAVLAGFDATHPRASPPPMPAEYLAWAARHHGAEGTSS
jgi:hypothetical protein